MNSFGVGDTLIIAAMVALYIAFTSWMTARSRSRNSGEFMLGGRTLPATVVGVLMLSEFIGAKSTIGTAQGAFESGMAASWAVLSAAVAFPLFGLLLARKLYNSGEFTISGAIAKRYGKSTRLVVSLIMIYALLLVNVGNYISGAASISVVLKTELPLAALVIAVVSTFHFAFGGMKSLAYVNLVHSGVKYLGVLVVLAVALHMSGGVTPIMQTLPPSYFSWNGALAPSTLAAYFIGTVGAVFSTQYIIQAIASTRNADAARRSTFIAGALAIPVSLALGLIGVAARYLYPGMDSLYALPIFLQSMNVFVAGFVTVALVASIFVSVGTVALAISSLVVRDFYAPYYRPTPEREFRATRSIAVAIGFIPLLFVVGAPALLELSFFTRAVRLSVAMVAMIAFYLPFFDSNRGATCGLLASVVITTVWYLLGNPYGVDNMYIALATPAIVIFIEKLFRWKRAA